MGFQSEDVDIQAVLYVSERDSANYHSNIGNTDLDFINYTLEAKTHTFQGRDRVIVNRVRKNRTRRKKGL